MSSELMQALLEVALKVEIEIHYGKKLIGVEEVPQSVSVNLEMERLWQVLLC